MPTACKTPFDPNRLADHTRREIRIRQRTDGHSGVSANYSAFGLRYSMPAGHSRSPDELLRIALLTRHVYVLHSERGTVKHVALLRVGVTPAPGSKARWFLRSKTIRMGVNRGDLIAAQIELTLKS
jgi:hypothetical protein